MARWYHHHHRWHILCRSGRLDSVKSRLNLCIGGPELNSLPPTTVAFLFSVLCSASKGLDTVVACICNESSSYILIRLSRTGCSQLKVKGNNAHFVREKCISAEIWMTLIINQDPCRVAIMDSRPLSFLLHSREVSSGICCGRIETISGIRNVAAL